MANKFRWWTKGRPNKPLKSDAPLLLKIRNGDFDYSYMFSEARMVRETAQMAYENTYKNYGGTNEQNRIEAALEEKQRYNKRALKLDESEAEKELEKLRGEKRTFPSREMRELDEGLEFEKTSEYKKGGLVGRGQGKAIIIKKTKMY